MVLMVGASHDKSTFFLAYCSWILCKRRDNVASQDHLIEDSCKFKGGSPSQYVSTLRDFVATDIVVVEI